MSLVTVHQDVTIRSATGAGVTIAHTLGSDGVCQRCFRTSPLLPKLTLSPLLKPLPPPPWGGCLPVAWTSPPPPVPWADFGANFLAVWAHFGTFCLDRGPPPPGMGVRPACSPPGGTPPLPPEA
jgi:hypothetical protein